MNESSAGPMRLATVQDIDGAVSPGLVRPDGLVVLLASLGVSDALAVIESGEDGWNEVCAFAEAGEGLPVDSVTFLPPIPRPPRNVFCVGANYVEHVAESRRPTGSAMPDVPVIFTKPWTSLCGHESVVDIDGQPSTEVDWEAEIAVIMGRGGKNIESGRALDHVFGYCLANDLSARDLQMAGGSFSQWFKGKSLDDFCPLGPWVVHRDDIADKDAIDVSLTVNGALKQKFISGDMNFKVGEIVEYLSQGMELLPGDVILTGTASGVGFSRTPPEYLTVGDEVEISSNVLGQLRTYIGKGV